MPKVGSAVSPEAIAVLVQPGSGLSEASRPVNTPPPLAGRVAAWRFVPSAGRPVTRRRPLGGRVAGGGFVPSVTRPNQGAPPFVVGVLPAPKVPSGLIE